eukprot:3371258-Prymnesium_polylepis.1
MSESSGLATTTSAASAKRSGEWGDTACSICTPRIIPDSFCPVECLWPVRVEPGPHRMPLPITTSGMRCRAADRPSTQTSGRSVAYVMRIGARFDCFRKYVVHSCEACAHSRISSTVSAPVRWAARPSCPVAMASTIRQLKVREQAAFRHWSLG